MENYLEKPFLHSKFFIFHFSSLKFVLPHFALNVDHILEHPLNMAPFQPKVEATKMLKRDQKKRFFRRKQILKHFLSCRLNQHPFFAMASRCGALAEKPES